MTPPIVDEIREMFRVAGGSLYGGEAVTQAEHALQAAMLAERDGAPAPLIAAALLHDVGHLLHALPDDAPELGIDDRHEDLAADWLGRRLGPAVVEPVRLHVAAKRYLCAVDPGYERTLSPPSLMSLRLQGGPMSPGEAADFAAHPHADAAVRLRRYDDEAKVPDLATPTLDHFLDAVARAAGDRTP